MRRALIALSITAAVAVALVAEALLDSDAAAWIAFVAIFVLGFGWSMGLFPSGGSDVGGDS